MTIHFDGATGEILITPDFAPEIEIEGRVQAIIKHVLLVGKIEASSSVVGTLTVV